LLGEVDVLDDENRERLRALSVTTVEELFGLIAADPEATSEFLGSDADLASIQADIGHAMCAVGYSSDTGFVGGGYLILRNSWGPDWAAQSPIAPGHALLPYLYLELYGWECYTATM
jgi:hypothetical protein